MGFTVYPESVMGDLMKFASAGMVNIDTVEHDKPFLVELLLRQARDNFPDAELIGEPRFEVGELWANRVEYPPNVRPYRLQIDVRQP